MLRVYLKPFCPYCIQLLKILRERKIKFDIVDVTEVRAYENMKARSGHWGVPQIELGNVIIYDYSTEESLVDDVEKLISKGYRCYLAGEIQSQIKSL